MRERKTSRRCVLALDLGSSSVRAGLYDAAGVPLAGDSAARVVYHWRSTPDGGMEIAAERLFRLVARLLDGALERARAARTEVAAVGISCFWHSLLGVGADGAPLTPVYGWGEMRSAAAALRLRERVDADAAHQRTGCFLHPSYPTAKLPWLRESAGDTFRRAAAWMSFAEYLELRLSGVRRCSVSMASGSGLLDLRTLRWDPEMTAAAGIGEGALSELAGDADPAPALLPEWARRWPELARVPWYPPLGDGACASLGSGAAGRGRVGITVGTSAAVRALWTGDPVRVPSTLWCYRLDAARPVMGRALSNGGNAVSWMRRRFRLPPDVRAEAALAALEPDAHGLTVVPSLVGERAAGWERWSGGAVLGLKLATRPEEVLRAWLEAVAYRVADAFDALEEALGPAGEVVGSGGALHASTVWPGILADVLGRRVVLSTVPEESGRGAALAALEHLGGVADAAAAPPPHGRAFEPDPARHERYRAARARQREAEERLASLAPQ